MRLKTILTKDHILAFELRAREYENFDYLAEVLMKMRAQRDADWERKQEQTWSTY